MPHMTQRVKVGKKRKCDSKVKRRCMHLYVHRSAHNCMHIWQTIIFKPPFYEARFLINTNAHTLCPDRCRSAAMNAREASASDTTCATAMREGFTK